MDLRPLFYFGILALGIAIAVVREWNQRKNSEKAKSGADGKPAEEVAANLERSTGDYALKAVGEGEKVQYDSRIAATTRFIWVSRETASDGNPLRIRKPRSVSKTFRKSLPFKAADKTYTSLNRLLEQKSADGTYRDCFGRVVLSVTERFPCFDSHDMLNEKRHYRWWIIVEEGYISVIYYTDEQNSIYVTDDAQDLESKCVDELKKHGYLF